MITKILQYLREYLGMKQKSKIRNIVDLPIPSSLSHSPVPQPTAFIVNKFKRNECLFYSPTLMYLDDFIISQNFFNSFSGLVLIIRKVLLLRVTCLKIDWWTYSKVIEKTTWVCLSII